jgi:hypothetical protein
MSIGYYDLEAETAEFSEEGLRWTTLSTPNSANPWLRKCSDMYLDGNGTIWAAAASDPGDVGPFVSYVNRVGSVSEQGNTVGFDDYFYSPSYGYESSSWTVQGFKIEAICAPIGPGGVLTFATDDEGYGGTFRMLGPINWN